MYQRLSLAPPYAAHNDVLIQKWVTALRPLQEVKELNELVRKERLEEVEEGENESAGDDEAVWDRGAAHAGSSARIAIDNSAGTVAFDPASWSAPVSSPQSMRSKGSRGSSRVASSEDPSIADHLAAVRSLFYSMLRSQYRKDMQSGRLPNNCRSIPLVLESVALADAMCYEPLCDVVHTLMSIGFATDWRLKPLTAIARFMRDIRSGTFVGKHYVPVRRGNADFDLCSIVGIMDAHAAVSEELPSLVASARSGAKRSTLSRSAFSAEVARAVVRESELQVQLIKDFLMLNQINLDLLCLVRTQHLALLLLRDCEVRIRQWLTQHTLQQQEADELLCELAADHQAVLSCGSDGKEWWTAPDADIHLQLPLEVYVKQPQRLLLGDVRLLCYADAAGGDPWEGWTNSFSPSAAGPWHRSGIPMRIGRSGSGPRDDAIAKE